MPESTAVGSKTAARAMTDSESSDEDNFIDDSVPVPTVVNNVGHGTGSTSGPTFQPHYLLSEWEVAGSAVRRLSVAIWLPSGVSKGDYSYNLAKCGKVLEVRIQWPRFLTDTLYLHKFWLCKPMENGGIQPYHPKIHGFEKHLKSYRARKSQTVIGTAYITLPFVVETHFEESLYCRWQDTTHRCLYITMRGASDGYDDQGEDGYAVQEAEAPAESSTQQPPMYQTP